MFKPHVLPAGWNALQLASQAGMTQDLPITVAVFALGFLAPRTTTLAFGLDKGYKWLAHCQSSSRDRQLSHNHYFRHDGRLLPSSSSRPRDICHIDEDGGWPSES